MSHAEAVRHLVSKNCKKCGEPVYADQGYYSVTGEHWGCHESTNTIEKRGESRAAKVRDLSSIFLRRRCPEGQGKVARRVKSLAVEAIEKASGGQVHTVTMWNQQGAYRGMKWDLDAWGINFRIILDGHDFGGCASSLATMTQCLREVAQGGEMFAEDDGTLYFSLFARFAVDART